MDRRSVATPRTPVSRSPARSAVRARPMEDRVDSMRIGGFVMLGLAAAQILEHVVMSFWLHLDTSGTGTAGFAAFDALLGIAMLQGSDTARKVVLWLTGFAAVGMLLLLGLLFAAGFSHLWPVFATSLATLVGVFLLNASTEHRRGVVIAALLLVVVGWVGSVVASIALAGTVDLASMKTIRDWSSPQRSFENAEAGIALKVPAQWVVLKDGNPIAEGDKPLVTLAHTEIQCSAQVQREARTFSSVVDNLEYYLDGIAKAKAAKEAEFQSLDRRGTSVGGLPARRMTASWKKDKEAMIGSFTAWQDGDVFYYLSVAAPRIITKRFDEEVQALESSLTVTAPWTAFLRDTGAAVRQGCPLLSEGAILALARVIPKDSPPEVYCREGYRLAVAGRPQMDAGANERLIAGMKAFFAALPKGKSERFGTYVEHVRARQRTTPAEDREMTEAARTAVEALAPEVQDDLRAHFAMAIELAMFEKQVAGR